MSKYHMSVKGSPAYCVAAVRSCPRGGEESYLRFIGVEGPARAMVRDLKGVFDRRRFYEDNSLSESEDTILAISDVDIDGDRDEFIDGLNNSDPEVVLNDLLSGNLMSRFTGMEDSMIESEETSGDDLNSLIVDGYNLSDGSRAAIAGHSNVSEDTLRLLSKDESVAVRKAVGKNKRSPVEVLEKLTVDSDAGVRKFVAQNMSTPDASLEWLSIDEDDSVRMAVARNGSTSVDLLRKLASRDRDSNVRSVARSNLETLIDTRYMVI